MREIKFRGKRVDNGEWVYGWLYKWCRQEGGIERYSIQNDSGAYQIDPKTVGQFTGLKDKDGKKIYEGDVMSECGEVVFDDGAFAFADLTGHQHPSRITQDRVRRLNILGNIHDNPELLEDRV